MSTGSDKPMEIERKFLVPELPADIECYPHKEYVQGYLNRNPVIRVRNEGGDYVMTYKGQGLLAREEHNLALNEESFNNLLPKCDGIIIEKTRHFIPISDSLTAELDVFKGELAPLQMVEVEFESMEQAESFTPPEWFGKEVTDDPNYHNSVLSQKGMEK